MNREIKFRGQRIDTKEKEWVYGLPAYGSGGNYNKICGWMGDDGAEQYAEIEVNPKTIGESTGLQDKNGKDIYEGDILSIVTSCAMGYQMDGKTLYLPAIVFGRFCVKENSLYVFEGFHIDGGSIQYRLSQGAVVAGNIYENPELLTPVNK